MKKIKLLEFINRHIIDIGWPPTVREIQHEFGMSSTSVAVYWINKAVKAGLIERGPGSTRVARGLRITEKGQEALMATEEKD